MSQDQTAGSVDSQSQLMTPEDDVSASTLAKPTEFQNADVLPSSVPKNIKGVVFKNGVPWIPIFCANCGADGGFIPEETKDFAFYLCDPCGDKWAPLAGTYLVPDDIFWERVKQTQLERYGRELTGDEVAECLKDDNHILTRMTKDRYDWKNVK